MFRSVFAYKVFGNLRCDVLLILHENWKVPPKTRSMHYSLIEGEVTGAAFWVSVCWAVMVMTGRLTYFKERGSEEGV